MPAGMARQSRILELAEQGSELLSFNKKGSHFWEMAVERERESVEELGDLIRRELHRSKGAVEDPSDNFFRTAQIPSPARSLVYSH